MEEAQLYLRSTFISQLFAKAISLPFKKKKLNKINQPSKVYTKKKIKPASYLAVHCETLSGRGFGVKGQSVH